MSSYTGPHLTRGLANLAATAFLPLPLLAVIAIMLLLVVGAGEDIAMLIVSREREARGCLAAE